MSDDVKLGDGDVAITLDGQNLVLKPSYAACLALSRGEGLVMLSHRCQQLDGEAMTKVVAAGLGRNPPKLGEHIYTAGLVECRDACVLFISVLANGGRRSKAVKEAEGPLESSETTAET